MERALFEIPSTFDFYNNLCHTRCEEATELLPFLNACPQCPDHYESAHCNKCCQGGASSIKLLWHGCAATLTFASTRERWDDCGVKTPFEARPRFVDCDCYDTLLDPANFDPFGCVLYDTITMPEGSIHSDVCIVSTKSATFGHQIDIDILAIDFSTPLPAVLGLINEVEVPVGPNDARMNVLATYFDTTCIVANEDSPIVLPIFPGYGKFPNTCHDFGFIDLQNGNPPLPDSIEHFVGYPPREAEWYEFIDGTSMAFWPATTDGEGTFFEPSFATCQCSKCDSEVESIPPSKAMTQPPNTMPFPPFPTRPGLPHSLPSSGPTVTNRPGIATSVASNAPTLPRHPGPPRPGTATSTAPTLPRRPGITTTLPSDGPTLPRRPGIATKLPSPAPTLPRRPGNATSQPTTTPTLRRQPATGTALPSRTPTLPRRPGPHRMTLVPSMLILTVGPSYLIEPNSPSLSPTTTITLSTSAPSPWPTVPGVHKPIPQTVLPPFHFSVVRSDFPSSQHETNVPSQSPKPVIQPSQPSLAPTSQRRPKPTPSTWLPTAPSTSVPTDASSDGVETNVPSESPSIAISLLPSLQPSSEPITKQTSFPSTQWSSIPSDVPSYTVVIDGPSQSPSIANSSWPSTQPSSEPVRRQTFSPSIHSSSLPSGGSSYIVVTDVPSQPPSVVKEKWETAEPSPNPTIRTLVPSVHSLSVSTNSPSFMLKTNDPSQSPSGLIVSSPQTTAFSLGPTVPRRPGPLRKTAMPSVHDSTFPTDSTSKTTAPSHQSQSPSAAVAPSPTTAFHRTIKPSLPSLLILTESPSFIAGVTEPSQLPTPVITPWRTEDPSFGPTYATSPVASHSSLHPSNSPSYSVTILSPSGAIAASPTKEPSPYPTLPRRPGPVRRTSVPSVTPSLALTHAPSNKPAKNLLSQMPSSIIVSSPMTKPLCEPTIKTLEPSNLQSITPSAVNSVLQSSAKPTVSPSQAVSLVPSLETRNVPTAFNSTSPTIEGTEVSSVEPNFVTDNKTVSPTLDPSGTPTIFDLVAPSIRVPNTDLPAQHGKCATHDLSKCNKYASSWCRSISAPSAIGSGGECRFEDGGTRGRSLDEVGGLDIHNGLTKEEILTSLAYHNARLAFLRFTSRS